LVEDIHDKIKSLTYNPVIVDDNFSPISIGYNIDDDKNKTCFYDEKLYGFIDSCLESIYKKHFKYSVKHVISDLWATKATFGTSSSFHQHAYSVFSGVLYLQDSNTSTTFMFEDNLAKTWEHFTNCNIQKITHVSKSIKGKCLIWPSKLLHRLDTHKEKETRYTVAFNSFWDGTLYDKASGVLNIETKKAGFFNNVK
jgi:uncharacterized protein (TIGR02466 family)